MRATTASGARGTGPRAARRMLAAALCAAGLLLAALPAAAQQVTKVGICDFTKVLSTALDSR
jgi:Skp family chaperone for outer membrane proteins